MVQRKQSVKIPVRPVGGFQGGFTLVELMITIVVLAIAVAAAAPGFRSMIEDSRNTAHANALLASLNLARSEAVKRGVPVTLTATSGNFATGWCIHLGADCVAAANIIRVHDGVTATRVFASATAVQFDARGARLLPAVDASISLQPEACAAGSLRLRNLVVGLSGRVNSEQGACL